MMNMLRAKSEIEESIQVEMERYRQVRQWQEDARRCVGGNPAQYEARKSQLDKLIHSLKQAEEALSEAINIDEMETATNGENNATENLSGQI